MRSGTHIFVRLGARLGVLGVLGVLGLLGAVGVLGVEPAVAQLQRGSPSTAATADPQVLADRIQAEVAAIRGLEFKHPVKAENQSTEDAARYVDAQIDDLIPPALAEHFSAIVRKVGLYRGDEELEFRSLVKEMITSQAAAYYDPGTGTFFVLMQEMPDVLLGTVYSHELYHGLQDQYFDLDAYTADENGERLDDDQSLARQAVVEGEATYVMTIWSMQSVTGRAPPRAALDFAIRQQIESLDMEALSAALEQPEARALIGEELSQDLAAAGELPRFVIETMMGAYLKGLLFVFAVEERGWSEVEKLYTDYPPVSTEQVLHPEKWFARESPLVFTWPSFEGSATAGWELLEENVLGEMQWRIVLAEHGLSAVAESVAAGWDGDRYAVLRNDASGELLLLMRTAWDTEDDAIEFENAYRRVLAEKYASRPEPTRMERHGAHVSIVEGGSQAALADLLAFVRSAEAERADGRTPR